MAVFNSLTFDGENSLDYGIYITGEGVYDAPRRAVEMVTIPGRNGTLAIDQGRFENIEVTYHAGCFADSQADFADKVMKFRNALASRYTYKRLTDEYHPDEYRLGLYKSGLDVDAVRYGTAGEFNIVFDCKPQRFLVDGDRAISPTDWSDVQTESGELVTIESDGSLAVKALEVSLSPIQDLNGYSKPWVGGAGKNLLNYDAWKNVSVKRGTAVWENNGVTLTATDADCYTEYNVPSSRVAVNEGETVTLSWESDATTKNNSSVYIFPNGVANDDMVSKLATTGTLSYTVGSGITYITFRVGVGMSGNTIHYRNIMIRKSGDASYEPYSNICPISGRTEVNTIVSPTTSATDGRTYTTALGRTVYGGTLDVVSGELVVDRAIKTLNGAEDWSILTAPGLNQLYTSISGILYQANTANVISDKFNSIPIQQRQGNYNTVYAYSAGVGFNVEGYSQTSWKEFLAQNPVQIVYELATPQTIQLTPQQIDLLLGTNHLWSDGEITVEYGVHPYYNPTPFASKPLIKVTGTGTLTVNGVQIAISATPTTIDCELMEAYNGTTSRNSDIVLTPNEFPTLAPGENTITLGSGITKLEITPRWWRI